MPVHAMFTHEVGRIAEATWVSEQVVPVVVEVASVRITLAFRAVTTRASIGAIEHAPDLEERSQF